MKFASGETQRSSGGRMSEEAYPAASSLLACLPQAAWLAPFAVVGGAVASGAVLLRSDWPLLLAMAMLLALAWVVVWSVIAGVNWSAPLAVWRGWTFGAAIGALPYARPDSEAAYLARRLGQLRSWLERELWPRYGNLVLAGAAGLTFMVVLAAALGPQAVLLALAVLCMSQLAVVACRGDGHPSAVLEGAAVVGLPMLLGSTTFGPITLDVLSVGVALAIVFAGVREGSPKWRDAGYALAVSAAVAMRQPIGAFVLAVIWSPQLILGLRRGGYRWLMAGLLAFAVAVA